MINPSERRDIFLKEMGIGPVWQSRQQGSMTEVTAASDRVIEATALPPVRSAASNADITSMDWQELAAAVSTCGHCSLCQTRTQTVLGTGDIKANWLFVGEAPGVDEDQAGVPLVGAAGKLLDNMLLAMGLKRDENVYITNIVKCRPADTQGRDRPPTEPERTTCLPYLERQIALIEPTIIVALGKTAAISLLGLSSDSSLSTLRGTVHQRASYPVIVTYHPAYLLRQPAEKSHAWHDLRLAMSTYALHSASA